MGESLLYNPRNFTVKNEKVIPFEKKVRTSVYSSGIPNFGGNTSPSSSALMPGSNKPEAVVEDYKVTTTGKYHNYSFGNTLKDRETVKIGDTKVTITDPYAVRTFEGREGEHSTGIDIKTSTGNAIALSDGVIESVRLQGNGDVIKPTDGSAAGYYVTVKNSDGSRTQYMHLDPMNDSDMKKLTGKKLKRGETIWGYLTGSGSMTGPHIKVRHYGEDTEYNVDPSNLILGKKYSFIPDGKGNNILGNNYNSKSGSFRSKIDDAAKRRNLNDKQIKALYVLNGVEDNSGTATEMSFKNTSADRIKEVFGGGSVFGSMTNAEIDVLKKDDKAFFDKAYGNKLDNRGEGYKFRGRGGVQLTGRSNYQKITNILNKNGVNIDLVKNPELAADPRYSAEILVAFAEKEGMFTKGSGKYLSDSDYDLIAKLDPNAIDKLHNITNAKADNVHMTKIAKQIYGV